MCKGRLGWRWTQSLIFEFTHYQWRTDAPIITEKYSTVTVALYLQVTTYCVYITAVKLSMYLQCLIRKSLWGPERMVRITQVPGFTSTAFIFFIIKSIHLWPEFFDVLFVQHNLTVGTWVSNPWHKMAFSVHNSYKAYLCSPHNTHAPCAVHRTQNRQ